MMKVLVSEDIWEFDLEAALKEISAQRREQALKFKFEQGQRLCVLAYQLLKEGLRQEYGITENPIFEYNEHGKPLIIGHPEIFFNLSHCKEAAICVVSDQPVGIDVESIRGYKESLVNYTMNDEEIAQIKSERGHHKTDRYRYQQRHENSDRYAEIQIYHCRASAIHLYYLCQYKITPVLIPAWGSCGSGFPWHRDLPVHDPSVPHSDDP